jgi:hypothetical protein
VEPYVGGNEEDGYALLMKSLLLEIPEDIIETARIPPDERETAIKRELAVHLYTRGILPKTAARRLSGLRAYREVR